MMSQMAIDKQEILYVKGGCKFIFYLVVHYTTLLIYNGVNKPFTHIYMCGCGLVLKTAEKFERSVV